MTTKFAAACAAIAGAAQSLKLTTLALDPPRLVRLKTTPTTTTSRLLKAWLNKKSSRGTYPNIGTQNNIYFTIVLLAKTL